MERRWRKRFSRSRQGVHRGVAWIELHQSVWTHRKTMVLAAELGIPDIYAAAHMAHLWCWAVDNAPTGELTGLPAHVIAKGAGWQGDPEAFLEATIAAGYIDRDGDRLFLHDWEDYAGRLIDLRRKDRDRKRELRHAYQQGVIDAVRARDGNTCRYCGKSVNWNDRRGPDGGTYDHIIPDGPTTVDNLVVCCRACHSRKGGRTPQEAGMRLLPPGGNQNDPGPEPSPNPVRNQKQSGTESNSDLLTLPNLTEPDQKDDSHHHPLSKSPARSDGGQPAQGTAPFRPRGIVEAELATELLERGSAEDRAIHHAFFAATGRLMTDDDLDTLHELKQEATPDQIVRGIQRGAERARRSGKKPKSLRYFVDVIREVVQADRRPLGYELPGPDDPWEQEMRRRRELYGRPKEAQP